MHTMNPTHPLTLSLSPNQSLARDRVPSRGEGTKPVWALVALLSFACFTHEARGQASFPMLMSLEPLAVQAGGHATEHLVQARYNLNGTYKIFVSGTGVTGEAEQKSLPAEPKPAEE